MTLNTDTSRTLFRRVAIAAVCVGAFMVMASVFSPDQTRAGGPVDSLRGVPPKSIDYPAPHDSTDAYESTDPHDGLRSLGMIEDRGYTILIFATQEGPRYTIYEKATGTECGALLSQDQVHRAYPELRLPAMEFNGDSPLMLIESAPDWRW